AGEPAVNVRDLASDAGRQVRQQERGGIAHVFNGDGAAQWCSGFHKLENKLEVFDAGRGKCFDGAGRDTVGANPQGAQVGGQITHAGFQRGLGQAHGVVVRHHALRAQVGKRQHRTITPFQHGKGGFGQGGEAVGGDVVGDPEVFTRQPVKQFAGNGFAGCETDGVHQPVKAVPLFAQLLEGVFDVFVAADVARNDDVGPEVGGELLDALFETVAH